MRIWHEKLIPKLCQKHLCGCWREALGCFKIITEGKKGYSKHPATKEYIHAIKRLYIMLYIIRQEMLKRGYHPKELPRFTFITSEKERRKTWQSLKEQIEVLKEKKKTKKWCKCQPNEKQ